MTSLKPLPLKNPAFATACACFFSEQKYTKLENNESIDIIYTDIAKAFDSVCHNKLLTVLSAYGFRGKILTWIKSFLSNRLQYVSINNQHFTPLPVISNVPQGSTLDPLLFVIYINDIVDITPLSDSHNGLYLYADDTKLFNIGSNFVNLQAALTNFLPGCKNDNMTLLPPNVIICVLLVLV